MYERPVYHAGCIALRAKMSADPKCMGITADAVKRVSYKLWQKTLASTP